jgi:glycosyltransferase involved in cell wall biosynthesis
MMRWSIIIFCYNEQTALATVIQSALQFIRHPERADSEIILVDDGSTDGSSAICVQATAQHPEVHLIRHPHNRGIGAALKSGYDTASKDWVCAIPGDGQFDVFELVGIPPLARHEFVSFYRKDKRYNLYRKLLTLFNNLFNRFFLGIYLRDVNWIKVYSLEQLRFSDYRLESSLIESEISGKLLKSGWKAVELPSQYHRRLGGSPKGGSWRTLWKAVVEMRVLAKLVNGFNKTYQPENVCL